MGKSRLAANPVTPELPGSFCRKWKILPGQPGKYFHFYAKAPQASRGFAAFRLPRAGTGRNEQR
jgi:hypothetical protein